MNYLTVIHDCRMFLTWKKAYDADAPRRAAAGLTDMHVLRDRDNVNLVALMFAVSDVARATAFFESPALAAHMTRNAGVVGPPERHFWNA